MTTTCLSAVTKVNRILVDPTNDATFRSGKSRQVGVTHAHVTVAVVKKLERETDY